MKQGFIKVAAVTVDIRVADVWHNCKEICKRMKEAEKMLALSEPLPEHVEQVKRYGEDTKKKFPNYNVRTYVVYICANKGWKCWEV